MYLHVYLPPLPLVPVVVVTMGVLPTSAMLLSLPVAQTPSQAGSHVNHQQQWATSVAQGAQQ